MHQQLGKIGTIFIPSNSHPHLGFLLLLFTVIFTVQRVLQSLPDSEVRSTVHKQVSTISFLGILLKTVDEIKLSLNITDVFGLSCFNQGVNQTAIFASFSIVLFSQTPCKMNTLYLQPGLTDSVYAFGLNKHTYLRQQVLNPKFRQKLFPLNSPYPQCLLSPFPSHQPFAHVIISMILFYFEYLMNQLSTELFSIFPFILCRSLNKKFPSDACTKGSYFPLNFGN
ncbi:hypothetical protein FGO68_gene7227 [Halteria grandinella]|uniref:Uncharacterized protein n=1 Tax=Halteria grandinella TaxID=5974 RepID=A0A8J8NNL2_HALGN|nr:hypothetical protein FGO68_gene7227 [Halteria grandinella]